MRLGWFGLLWLFVTIAPGWGTTDRQRPAPVPVPACPRSCAEVQVTASAEMGGEQRKPAKNGEERGMLPPCQGWGRGFESRRPLDKSAGQRHFRPIPDPLLRF